MHAIDVLISGVRGAENGTAHIYQRGTTTYANYYLDFEAESQQTGGAIDLDANGGTTVYVNQLVDVEVRDSDGLVVRTFSSGAASPSIEVRSQSFTGTDYQDGAAAAGNPIDLEAVLNLWKDTNGAIDWKVLFEGSAATIQAALGSLTNAVFNVKSPAYGATGDGTTDDTTAIINAIAAATAATAGGTVFFPPGTYRITNNFTWPADVNFLGSGMTLSIISMDADSEIISSVAATSGTNYRTMKGLKFVAAQAVTTSGCCVNIQAAALLQFEDCYFGDADFDAAMFVVGSTAAAKLKFVRCVLEVTHATAGAVYLDQSDTDEAEFTDCRFICPATFTGHLVFGRILTFHGCYFDTSALTSGTLYCFGEDNTGITVHWLWEGCYFNFAATANHRVAGGSTLTLGTTATVYELGNGGNINFHLYTTFTHYVWTASSTFVKSLFKTRQGMNLTTSGGATTATVTLAQMREYAVHTISIAGTQNFTIQLDEAELLPGHHLTLVIANASGGNSGTMTFDTAYAVFDNAGAGNTLSMTTGTMFVIEFVAQPNSGSAVANRWVMVGAASLAIS